MKITCDPNKRARTIEDRGLDFMDAVYVFGGKHFTVIDSRKDYGEVRNITVGHLDNRMVMIGWVQRGEAHLRDPSIPVASVAKRYNVSRTTLYKYVNS